MCLDTDFYPRPHMEGDASNTLWLFGREHFYPRPHMEGDMDRDYDSRDYNHFYPRPHMEGDQRAMEMGLFEIKISTHALTWRATTCKIRANMV